MLRISSVAAARCLRSQAKNEQQWSLIGTAAVAASASLILATWGDPSNNVARNEKSESSEDKKQKGNVFDAAKDWMKKQDGENFLKDHGILSDDDPTTKKPQSDDKSDLEQPHNGLSGMLWDFFVSDDDSTTDEKEESSESPSLTSMAKTFKTLLSSSSDSVNDAVTTLIAETRTNSSAKSIDKSESKSFDQLYALFQKNIKEVGRILDESFGHLDLSTLDPTSMYYYMEREDEIKNPSWKRMRHRYHKGVSMDRVHNLNAALHLSELSYAATADEIKLGLEKDTPQEWELVFFESESYPGEPSHFIAVKKGQPRSNNELEVAMVVRGTNSVPDILTDALMEAEEYRGGLAHKGIVQSGKFLVDSHKDLFENLRKSSNKEKIKLLIVGHSLGAGAAAIAGMEFKSLGNMNVSVTGFGCPALLSKELSESTKEYITTVIADSDVVPRLNAASIANAALDIMEYDWISKGRRDVEQALNELSSNMSFLFSKSDVKKAMGYVDSAMKKYAEPRIKSPTDERMEPKLFPPGTCVHFYRDGVGISASYAPCNFFREIDVSRTMIQDHLIEEGYRLVFLEAMRNHLNDLNFSFEDAADSGGKE